MVKYGSTVSISGLRLIPETNVYSGPLEVTLTDSIKGKMLLLLENQGWTETPAPCPPADTPRVLVVNFDTLGTIGTSDLIRIGFTERFQWGGACTAVAASSPLRPINVNAQKFTVFNYDRIYSFNSKPGSKLGEMLVSLESRGLGNCEVFVSFTDKPDLSLTFNFPDGASGAENKGVSTELSVGPFGTITGFFPGETYKVSTIKDKSGNPIRLETPDFSFQMPSFPETYAFEVDKTKGGADGSCTETGDTCGTLDSAFSTLDLLRIKKGILTLGTIDPLSTPQAVGSSREVSVSPKGTGQSSVVISSSFPASEAQVITVSGGTLKFANVDVTLPSSSLTLKLVKVTEGTFEMKDGSIKRDASSTANALFGCSTANDDVCAWGGVVELIDSTGSFISCNNTNHQSGAITQSGGSVTIKNVFFESNGASSADFPSARQNVFCSGDGQLEVTELTGDGKDETSLFPGISAADCSVTGEAKTMSIPTVDVKKSKVTLDKKTKSYVAEIAGSAFTPCGLSIEVFAVLKNGSEEVAEPLILNMETATVFTETAITTSIPTSHMENLTKNVAWTLRLKNGDERLSSQSFVLRKKPANNVWMIPVFIIIGLAIVAAVVVIVIVLWRRKNKQTTDGSVEAEEQTNH